MPVRARARSILQGVGTRGRDALLERRTRRLLHAAHGPREDPIDCVVYFADEPSTVYQVRQWLAPMAELDRRHPVALLVRRPSTAALLARDAHLPVHLAVYVAEVEDFVERHGVRIVFYVNNNRDNFPALRLTRPTHVHLSHGESDKVSMASHQVKAYDFAFIAGEASRQRILAGVRHLDPAMLVPIGRPQLDAIAGNPGRPLRADAGTERGDGNGRTTVLYAPTWEGDRPAMEYGSVVSHGVALTSALLESTDFRLVFRPHPRTGVRLPAHRAAVREITARIERARRRDPSAGHCRDTRPDALATMAASDACICDISAIAMDWLPQHKHLLVTRPVQPRAAVSDDGVSAAVPRLEATDAADVAVILRDLLARPVPAAQRTLVEHLFGDTAPGASTQRFLDAVDALLAATP